jgi:predicted Fe-Mo cluster-binding NifX family protein
MIACVPVAPTGKIDRRWGRASRVAVAEAHDGELVRWDEFDVSWDTLHDADSEGGHHARIARFLQEHDVEVVLADHMGEPMRAMLGRMGLEVRLGASGDARRAVLAVAPRAGS